MQNIADICNRSNYHFKCLKIYDVLRFYNSIAVDVDINISRFEPLKCNLGQYDLYFSNNNPNKP